MFAFDLKNVTLVSVISTMTYAFKSHFFLTVCAFRSCEFLPGLPGLRMLIWQLPCCMPFNNDKNWSSTIFWWIGSSTACRKYVCPVYYNEGIIVVRIFRQITSACNLTLIILLGTLWLNKEEFSVKSRHHAIWQNILNNKNFSSNHINKKLIQHPIWRILDLLVSARWKHNSFR